MSMPTTRAPRVSPRTPAKSRATVTSERAPSLNTTTQPARQPSTPATRGATRRRQARRGGRPATSASCTMVTSETMSKTGRPVSRWMSAVYGGMLVHSSTMAPMSG